MTDCEAGAVVLVHFPFTDLTATKRRPALVVSTAQFAKRHGDIVIVALTSQPQADPGQKLEHWEAVGLPKPTWLKPVIGTISRRLVERHLGRLAPADAPRVRAILRTIISGDYLG
jgi:mRNA interferase MazF